MSKTQNVPLSITTRILLKFYQGYPLPPCVGDGYNYILDRSIKGTKPNQVQGWQTKEATGPKKLLLFENAGSMLPHLSIS